MNNDAKGSTGPQFRSAPLITSAVLVGVGTFVIFAGLAVGGSHLLSATRRWVTAATPSRATTRTVAATIASRVRLEASARGPVSEDTIGTLQERSYL